MKHTIFVEKKKEYIQLEHIVLSIIRIKPKFYCIQMKKNLGRKEELLEEGMDLIIYNKL